MKSTIFAAFSLCAVALLMTTSVSGYRYCGAHDRRHSMRVYYFNSEFWVDILAQQAGKWNSVHSSLDINQGVYSILWINRERSATFPARSGDGQNVIGWLNDAEMMRLYNLSWGNYLGHTFSRKERDCGRVLETDVIFNPRITNFEPQTETPYRDGFHVTALHELGHVLTLDHEERGLSVMQSILDDDQTNVLYANDKVGWHRSAQQRFNRPSVIKDMGVFPLRRDGKVIYAGISPGVVSRDESFAINDFTVENLSPNWPFMEPGPRYRVVLENVVSGAPTEIGSFFWERFGPFSSWSGSLTFRVPANLPVFAEYRVVAVFDGQDDDRTNDRAEFGKIWVPR